MKKIIIFALLLIVSASSFSQPVTNTAPPVKTDYLKKSGGQTTTAWMLLVCGTVGLAGAFIAGGGISIGSGESFPVAVGVISGACVLGSIPFFLAASRNKKKALSLLFKNESAPQLLNGSFVNKSIPSLTLKISL